MARVGKRPGAGRPLGSRNKPKRAIAPIAPGPDALLSEQVALLVATGMSPADIAAALNMPELELRARCPRELEHGALIAKAQQITALANAAAKGNAGAGKALLAMIGQPTGAGASDAGAAADEPNDPITDRALRLLYGGKK